MQQDAPKLDDQSVQLEILVAIQCNDDDETSQVHFQIAPFSISICKVLHLHISLSATLYRTEWRMPFARNFPMVESSIAYWISQKQAIALSQQMASDHILTFLH